MKNPRQVRVRIDIDVLRQHPGTEVDGAVDRAIEARLRQLARHAERELEHRLTALANDTPAAA